MQRLRQKQERDGEERNADQDDRAEQRRIPQQQPADHGVRDEGCRERADHDRQERDRRGIRHRHRHNAARGDLALCGRAVAGDRSGDELIHPREAAPPVQDARAIAQALDERVLQLQPDDDGDPDAERGGILRHDALIDHPTDRPRREGESQQPDDVVAGACRDGTPLTPTDPPEKTCRRQGVRGRLVGLRDAAHRQPGLISGRPS